jgi:F0F1-type ATP synthase assembly protein I
MPVDPSSSSGKRLPIGLMVAGSEMASFTIAGLVVDYLLGTMPGFTVGLTLLGLIAAFYHLVKMAQAMAKKPGPPSPPPPPSSSEGGGA